MILYTINTISIRFQVYWLKAGLRIQQNLHSRVIINGYNQLIIDNVTVADGGNYTCVAECLGIEFRHATAKVTVIKRQIMLSPVIQLGPPDLKLTKPAVVTFQHCAPLTSTSMSILLVTKRLMVDSTKGQPNVSVIPWDEPETIHFDNWHATEMHTPSFTGINLEKPAKWLSVAFGDWTSNPDLDCKLLDATTAQLTCSTSVQFCIVGELRPASTQRSDVVQDQIGQNAPDRMKEPRTRSIATLLHLVAVGGRQSPNLDYNIRVYVLKDDHCTLERVIQEESQIGCHMLGRVRQFYFQTNGTGLTFLLEVLSKGWRSRLRTGKQVSELPF
ncbi:uncharacterized protein DEA37_0002319 [Paragonimus westermani]|uniref:Ig-like domain-containing protein n=1 Tax=Paragonimus westermani TaxID=34504 RepID=A0A5J4NYS3_9TREM|nr:uncharacterized protein DEA37_0002319 [Paragonimus westermani]